MCALDTGKSPVDAFSTCMAAEMCAAGPVQPGDVHRQPLSSVFWLLQIKALRHGGDGDVRALDTGESAVDAPKVATYLKRAFGPRLGDAEAALQVLAGSCTEDYSQCAPCSQSRTRQARPWCSLLIERRGAWMHAMTVMDT